MTKVAAVTVLYNPDSNLLDKLDTYLVQVDKLYLVDNSEPSNNTFLIKKIHQLGTAEYIRNDSNVGIAGALNIGTNRAINEGFDYLLTMDQDGKASSNMVNKLLKIMLSSDKIGIVAAEHMDPDLHEKPAKIITEEILYTMTNGNLLNLSAFKKVGGFLDELFIDHVDHEFCLRLNKNNYKVIKTNETFVFHKLGKAKKKRIFNINLYPTYHSPVRLYYRTRNRLYIGSLYKRIFPGYVKKDRKHMLREFFDIAICEKDLWNKIKMVLIGYIHYKKKLFGKFEDATGK